MIGLVEVLNTNPLSVTVPFGARISPFRVAVVVPMFVTGSVCIEGGLHDPTITRSVIYGMWFVFEIVRVTVEPGPGIA